MITLKERVACRCLAVVQLQEAEEEGEGSVDVEMGVRTSEREHRLAVCGVCVSVIMCAACRASHGNITIRGCEVKVCLQYAPASSAVLRLHDMDRRQQQLLLLTR